MNRSQEISAASRQLSLEESIVQRECDEARKHSIFKLRRPTNDAWYFCAALSKREALEKFKALVQPMFLFTIADIRPASPEDVRTIAARALLKA